MKKSKQKVEYHAIKLLWKKVEIRFGKPLISKNVYDKNRQNYEEHGEYVDLIEAISVYLKELREKGITLNSKRTKLGRSILYQDIWSKLEKGRDVFLTEEVVNLLCMYAGYDDIQDFVKKENLTKGVFEEQVTNRNLVGSESILAATASEPQIDSKKRLRKTYKIIGALLGICMLVVLGFFLLLDQLVPKVEKPNICLVKGQIVDDLNKPVTGVKVQFQGFPLSDSYSHVDGTFITNLELDKPMNVHMKLIHEDFEVYSKSVRLRPTNDTLIIDETFTLNSLIKDPVKTEKSQPLIRDQGNTFVLFFRGQEWRDCSLVKELEKKNYTFINSRLVQHKIEIIFPEGAIWKNIQGEFKYNRKPPSIIINGDSCLTCELKLERKSRAIPEAELNKFLKTQLNQGFQNPNLVHEIIKKL